MRTNSLLGESSASHSDAGGRSSILQKHETFKFAEIVVVSSKFQISQISKLPVKPFRTRM